MRSQCVLVIPSKSPGFFRVFCAELLRQLILSFCQMTPMQKRGKPAVAWHDPCHATRPARNASARLSFCAALLMALAFALHANAGADPVLRGMTPVLPQLLLCAEAAHPAIQAETLRAKAQWFRAAATDGFYDPQMQAGLLYADGPLRAPESFLPGYVEQDALAARGTLTVPVDPGVYLRASLTHWQTFDTPAALRDGHATVAGISAQLPLLKDRGFETARLATQSAEDLARTADALRDTVRQNVRLNVSAAYIALLRAQAAYQETLSASNRAARILSETLERVGLSANAAYELHTARMEVALRTDDAQSADNTRLQSLALLEQSIASPLPDDFATLPDELHRWAALCRASAMLTNSAPVLRPEFRAALQMIEARSSQTRLAATACQSDLSLRAGIGWRVDDSNWNYNDGDSFGWEGGLVWSRSFDLTAERETLRAADAELQAAHSDAIDVRIRIDTETLRARTALQSALQRFEHVQLAVDEAQKSLAAEEERFRLGEGRSRNVLDAQKDLTNANLRYHDVAAELLRAYLDLAYAAGHLAP